MEYDIIKDINTLTTIPEKTLAKLIQKTIYCICEAVLEDIKKDEKPITTVNIGIGKLYIGYDPSYRENGIKFKFKPSDTFDKALGQTIDNKLNLLGDALSASLAQKFEDIYKELC